jgi:hypothetical protein
MGALDGAHRFQPGFDGLNPENLEFNLHPTWEIAYNHFHNRLGISLPKMAAVIAGNRPTGVNHHMDCERLTHGEIRSTGLVPLKK